MGHRTGFELVLKSPCPNPESNGSKGLPEPLPTVGSTRLAKEPLHHAAFPAARLWLVSPNTFASPLTGLRSRETAHARTSPHARSLTCSSFTRSLPASRRLRFQLNINSISNSIAYAQNRNFRKQPPRGLSNEADRFSKRGRKAHLAKRHTNGSLDRLRDKYSSLIARAKKGFNVCR